MITEITLFKHNEPLCKHTSFRVGGPADFYICPDKENFVEQAVFTLKTAQNEKTALFTLGGGANVLAADSGFRGIVLDTTAFSGCRILETKNGVELACLAGTKSNDAAEFALENSFGNIEFLAGLPGTIGGAVWMNARCYESSVSDFLGDVLIINEEFKTETIEFKANDYAYKKSPYQTRPVLILEARFRVKKENRLIIEQKMREYRADREAKGHFSWPSAGSVFKNNHDFGKPTGKIIEALGLRGTQIGGARIADWHGNFIINTGNASASDIHSLISLITIEAKKKLGITLEPEIIFLGND
ncbi:MAG: UDP-N-acetylmuramate dehydrogenase [Termitinemataceae bacterium]|jgi:UDP-N-acetylmuramate dehydrogenase|nr:MAG: UDP-N-acetylmuramate dehydrogenase [Termitinemataceae bacterium]